MLIQDSIKKIKNRFDLVLVAARKAREIQLHDIEQFPKEEQKTNKCTVLALKSIEKSNSFDINNY